MVGSAFEVVVDVPDWASGQIASFTYVRLLCSSLRLTKRFYPPTYLPTYLPVCVQLSCTTRSIRTFESRFDKGKLQVHSFYISHTCGCLKQAVYSKNHTQKTPVNAACLPIAHKQAS